MVNRPVPPPPPQQAKRPLSVPRSQDMSRSQPIRPQPYGLKPLKPVKQRRWWIWLIVTVIVAVIAGIFSTALWYRQALTPVDSANTENVRVIIDEGGSVAQIARVLEQQQLIRSAFAFEIYARDRGSLQAGGYALSPSMSVDEIITHLEEGRFDTFRVTFLPGSTIWDIQENLVESGFSTEEVETALTTNYDHPLFASKPVGTSLEGYIFPETYELEGTTTVQELFIRTFDEFYGRLTEANLIAQFETRGLNVYQALTLASIVQKEVSDPEDERQVAQVFYRRLAEGVPLGADATFIYGAQVLGVEPRVTLDSPYNTRQVTGLPPGPIANMGISALEAVANPAEGDYLYFVSGDDGTTYFTRTEAEHEAAVAQYCRENCDIFQN